MKKIILLALALAACGDNLTAKLDGRTQPTPDASCVGCPAAPALGAQIDRLGRPAINTALNHAFDGTAGAGSAKDSYNADGSPGGWATAYTGPFAASLGIIDVLDTGLSCTAGACTDVSGTATPGAGCGNQAMFNGNLTGGGAPVAGSYTTLAAILSDDQLYLDTSKSVCELPGTAHANYLGVELNVLASLPNSCGGRAPTNDVMDASYTVLAVGLNGFNPNDFTPVVKDGVGPHADLSNDTFPFLGAPH